MLVWWTSWLALTNNFIPLETTVKGTRGHVCQSCNKETTATTMLALIQETLWSGWNGECQPSENTSLHESTGNGSRELFSNGGFDRSWFCDQMTTIYVTVTVRGRACTITVLAVLVAVRSNESRGKGWMSVRTEQEEKPAKTQKDVHTFHLRSSSSGCWWSCVSVSQTRPSVFPVPNHWTQIQTFTFIYLTASIGTCIYMSSYICLPVCSDPGVSSWQHEIYLTDPWWRCWCLYRWHK